VIATAKLKYLGVSSQKTRLVVNQVRGRNVGEALAILHYSPKLVAHNLEKLLKSAVANAQQSDPNVDVDQLIISRALVDDAPPMKRARAQSMGRIFRVLKRACHVTIDLDLSTKTASH
jgi:large subunit ribosomal protein L22